jgi:reductive dehalogenase
MPAPAINPSATSPLGKPFWIRRVDKPPYEIDESVLTRFNSANTGFLTASAYWGPDLTRQLTELNQSVINEGVAKGLPGNDLLARALAGGAQSTWRTAASRTLYSWTPLTARHPREAYGAAPWDGSPEDAARAVKVAAQFYGAGSAGIARLDRRWIYSHDAGVPIVFEDVDQPIVEADRRVIPNKVQYQISITIPQSFELGGMAPTAMASAATAQGYSLMAFVAGSVAEFLRGLGYVAIPCGNDTGLSVPMAIDAGLGELGRTGRLITPEWGPNVRLAKVLTDLPLAVDKPIEFGAYEFCKRCKKCAEHCPGKALSFEDEPSWEVTGPWSQPGKKVWPEHAANCLKTWREVGTGCSICVRVCPYTKRAETIGHEVVKGALSVAPIMGSLVATADDWLGYGQQRTPEAWWQRFPRPFGRDGF